MNSYRIRLAWQYLLPTEDARRNTQYEVPAPSSRTALVQAGVFLGQEYGAGGPVLVLDAGAEVNRPDGAGEKHAGSRPHNEED